MRVRQIHSAGVAMLVGVLCGVGVAQAVTFTQGVKALQDVDVVGAVSKGSGTFVIDHPLDPENKLLYHSFVESPEVRNIYDGIVALDEHGVAIVELPAYFEALNKDVTYFVRAVGVPMPNLHIQQRVSDNRFSIAGGVPGGEVSWMVTGVRHDPYIEANPIVPEVEKGPEALVERGEYLFEGYEHEPWWRRLTTFWERITSF